ncbi:MAG: protein kinase [Pleurocapsa sp. MO_226.B13]|nr:protein kinase [Pleurocapsa sp. MO_226.B13]
MSENLAGKTLKEHYYLEKKLDSGGFGTIYLAKDTLSAIGGNYIVKHFSPSYEHEAQLATAMRLFQQESNSLQKLGNHPQIPRIYDFFEQENHFFLVQELIEGQNLEQEFAASEPFTQAQAIKLLTDTLEVLKFIHQAGYIHRDLKPSNLIRNRFDRRIFVIDFGAVKDKIDPKNIGNQGEFSLTVGILSPGYTPDEQLRGRPEFESDLYALGMVVIQAMTGEHPQTLLRNANSELMWRDRLPAHYHYDLAFLDLVDKMVEQNWQQRYRSAAAVLEDLAKINSRENTALPSSKTSSIPEQESNLQSQTNKIKVLATLGILGTVIIFVWLYINNLRQEKFITYENEYIKVEYPASWSRKTKSNFLNTSVVFMSPKEDESDRFQERVVVIIEESSRPLSLKQYSERAVEQIENLSNFILSPPRPTTLGRSDGKYIIYQGTDRNQKVKRQEVWTVNYQQIYTVVYTAEPNKFDKFLPQAKKIVESLEILE